MHFGRRERDVGVRQKDRKESFYTCREKGVILMINTSAYSNNSRNNQREEEKRVFFTEFQMINADVISD